MEKDEDLVFPFEINTIKTIKLKKKTVGDETLLTDEGKIVNEFLVAGVSHQVIAQYATKFGVDFSDKVLSIEVRNDELKMGKDKILQTILIIAANQ